jgi:hypothetical protein
VITTARRAGSGTRAARWVLLFCTLFGLATMHTLGHAGMHVDTHVDTHEPAAVTTAMVSAAPDGHCPDGHCGGRPDHGRMSGWEVCLAVLGGLAVAVLLAALLLVPAAGLPASIRERLTGLRVPRPPPRRRVGLSVASVAVLRI